MCGENGWVQASAVKPLLTVAFERNLEGLEISRNRFMRRILPIQCAAVTHSVFRSTSLFWRVRRLQATLFLASVLALAAFYCHPK